MRRTSRSGAVELQSRNGNYREALFAIIKCLRLFCRLVIKFNTLNF